MFTRGINKQNIICLQELWTKKKLSYVYKRYEQTKYHMFTRGINKENIICLQEVWTKKIIYELTKYHMFTWGMKKKNPNPQIPWQKIKKKKEFMDIHVRL